MPHFFALHFAQVAMTFGALGAALHLDGVLVDSAPTWTIGMVTTFQANSDIILRRGRCEKQDKPQTIC